MTATGLALLVFVFFLTAVISVVTGGTSLITVPVMLEMGVKPHVAVATNMVALIFLSLGGTLPFMKGSVLGHKRLPLLIGLTLVGSILGALLLLVMPAKAMPGIIAAVMVVVVIFSLVKPTAGIAEPSGVPSWRREAAGLLATFLLGVYGGFFSGGYVAMLTAACVGLLDMTFLEAVAVTKVLNLFSSLIAVVIFAVDGIIDWQMSVPLSVVSFIGGVIGAVVARRLSNVWLRRIFLTTVVILAVKTLLVDLVAEIW